MFSRRRFMNDRIASENGDNLVLKNVKGSKMNALTLYGKSSQDGTPSPENPVPIVSAGDDGEINVSVSDNDTQSQTLTLSTPGGLPGIPVTSSGNYTDENGQAWICDEVDLARGVYVRRVVKHILDGSDDEMWKVYGTSGFYAEDVLEQGVYIRKPGLSNQFLVRGNSDSNLPGLWIGVNNNILYSVYNDFNDPSLEDSGLSNWKAHLAAHPLEVMTYLETPIETDLSSEELAAYKALHTYSPATTVSNDAEAWMKVGYREWRR